MYSVASCDTPIRAEDKESSAVAAHQEHAVREFLLACAASPFTAAHAQRISSLAGGNLDWIALVRLAECHGLVPLLWERVAGISRHVPDVAMETLRRVFQQNVRQTLFLTQLLFTISDLFQARGIDALPYKGPVLAELLYGNVSLREYSDIDILVHPADVPSAYIALQQAGFTPGLQLTSKEETAHIANGYEYAFHGNRDPNLLELQWRVMPHFYAVDFDAADFFRRAQTVRVGDRAIATLSHEDLVLVLCAHAAKHAWSKLSWIRDIVDLARSSKIAWDRVIDEAGRLGIRRMVAVTFRIANEILGTPSPAPVQELIHQDPEAGRIAEQLCRDIGRGEEPEMESLAYFRLMARVRERWSDRLRFGVRLAITPSVNEWALVRLPEPMFPLYRVVRVGRVVRKLLRRR
jgi:Uncharacterised nucleotidyltransferase